MARGSGRTYTSARLVGGAWGAYLLRHRPSVRPSIIDDPGRLRRASVRIHVMVVKLRECGMVCPPTRALHAQSHITFNR